MRILSAIAVVLLVALAWPASAADLYTGEAPLEEGETGNGDDVLAALNEVLVRLTGRVGENLVSMLSVSAGQAAGLVQTRQRTEVTRIDTEGGENRHLRLRIGFDESGVNRLLRDHDLPRWGRERPAVLLWVTEERAGNARFAADAWLEDRVGEHARRLGLEIVRPLGDARDVMEVTPEDIRGGFLDSAEPAARRYGTPVIAMLDLRRVGFGEHGLWHGRWNWRLQSRDDGNSATAEQPGELVERALDDVAAALAARFAVVPGSDADGRLKLTVVDLVDEIQYAEVLDYLQGLSPVEHVAVTATRRREVDFSLEVSGGGLEDILELGGVLTLVEQRPDGRLIGRLQH